MKLLANPLLYSEIQELMRLTVPLASAQVAQAATGFVDIVMMGWLGQDTLAGGGLAATTCTSLILAMTGLMLGASPLIASAYGVGDRKRIQQLAQQGIGLTLITSLFMMIFLSHFDLLMGFLGQQPKVVSIAKTYFNIILWGFFPALLFAFLKTVMSSLSQARSITAIVIGGTMLNAIGNYLLGFGKLGFPPLGLQGIAGASALSQWAMVIALIIYIRQQPQLKTYQFFRNLHQFSPQILKELLWIGLPIALSFTLESGLFTIITYMMGALGTEVLAAHQIVFQTLVLIFMVPLGMSFATTIRVGQWYGKGDLQGVKRAAYVSMGLGAGFMALMAIVLLLFPHAIISLYLDTQNPENAPVIALVIPLLKIAAISLILDGLQAITTGALRGLQDTRMPVLLSFLSFWGVGLTSGYLLGFVFYLGGVGLWVGQLFGVAAAAGIFWGRFRYHPLFQSKPL